MTITSDTRDHQHPHPLNQAMPSRTRSIACALATIYRRREPRSPGRALALGLARGFVVAGLLGSLMILTYFTGAADVVEWPTGDLGQWLGGLI